ncbi:MULTISPECIES: type II toxin-antitoxin system Phd/YefM family antitoxin [Larkinella]|uniref:Type II toxin-antitoxin system Phd/YefM family antitoxin n=1 Tax=Larkinella humicola TaxID=2607654 RepID=A0A5N1J9H3_9BACT|nr:type II toxin-antitoxin system Phd/YefM family antitoxin [Larkinella humicola]KAA9349302.1 type II toxin-antitoxin system Phd/YefM family antitoxin [Larkinella humicola]
MKTMSVGELKTHFSEVLKEVEAGAKVAITFGKKKEIKAFLVPKEEEIKPRKLGALQGKKYFLRDDFGITTSEEFEI